MIKQYTPKYVMLSGSAIPDCHEPTEKIQIVITYFKNNFRYTFFAEVLKGVDAQDQQ